MNPILVIADVAAHACWTTDPILQLAHLVPARLVLALGNPFPSSITSSTNWVVLIQGSRLRQFPDYPMALAFNDYFTEQRTNHAFRSSTPVPLLPAIDTPTMVRVMPSGVAAQRPSSSLTHCSTK